MKGGSCEQNIPHHSANSMICEPVCVREERHILLLEGPLSKRFSIILAVRFTSVVTCWLTVGVGYRRIIATLLYNTVFELVRSFLQRLFAEINLLKHRVAFFFQCPLSFIKEDFKIVKRHSFTSVQLIFNYIIKIPKLNNEKIASIYD